MCDLKWNRLWIRDVYGNRREGEDSIFVRRQEFADGFALFVDAVCPDGLHGEESLGLAFEGISCDGYLAIENHSAFWCRPFFGAELSALPCRVQELFLRTDEGYLCLLPLCGDVLKAVIRGSDAGVELMMHSNMDGLTRCENQPALICMEGQDPLVLAEKIAAKAVELLDNGIALRRSKAVPSVFDRLGWCSWDAFQIRVNHKGLLEKAKEFREKKIPVGFAVIDDMWADCDGLNEIEIHPKMALEMHKCELKRFEGDPTRFPAGMKGAISDLKKAGIRDIGVWFPTTGYWAGLDAHGEEAARQLENTVIAPRTVFLEDHPCIAPAPDGEKAGRFFDDLCGRVKAWGGDFVKIDNQSYHRVYRNMAPIGQSARAIQGAIDGAAEKFFGGALINCMGMSSECMLNRRSAVSRCSDDFMPESREWFAKNILQCAYNGLLQGRFYVNDWDMWWSDDEQAMKNSLCRAISGGPIYVSDKLGRSRAEIFRPLCLTDGRILRCDDSATPTSDCLIENPVKSGRIFKIRNVIGANGVLAVFNIDGENRPVSGRVSAAETGVIAGTYAYYEYFSGAFGVLEDGESIPVELHHNDDFKLYTFAPVGSDGIAVLGRLDLFMGVGIVETRDAEGFVALEGGRLGIVCVKADGSCSLRTVATEKKEHQRILFSEMT